MDPTTTSNPTPPQRPRHLQRNNISFSDEPPIANLGPITTKAKWTAENEAQLAYAQEELDKSQKRWSRGQEEWILEVEKLLEMKKEYKQFVKRRAKMVKKEGRRFKRPFVELASTGTASGEGSEIESVFAKDDAAQPTSKGIGDLIRRVSSAKSASSMDSSTRTTRTNSIQSNCSEGPRQPGIGFGKLLRRFSSK